MAEVPPESRPLRIFLVDDNSLYLDILTDFLHERGAGEVEVIGATTEPETVLSLALEARPDVILLDLNMPGITGLQLLPRLRAALPETAIVVVTLHKATVYREKALAEGADAYVPKANIPRELLPAIRLAVESRRRRG